MITTLHGSSSVKSAHRAFRSAFREVCKPRIVEIDGVEHVGLHLAEFQAGVSLIMLRLGWRSNRNKRSSGINVSQVMSSAFHFTRVDLRHALVPRMSVFSIHPDDLVPSDIQALLFHFYGVAVRKMSDLCPFSPVLVLDNFMRCTECGRLFPKEQIQDGFCAACYQPPDVDKDMSPEEQAAYDQKVDRIIKRLDRLNELEDWLDEIGGESALENYTDEELELLSKDVTYGLATVMIRKLK